MKTRAKSASTSSGFKNVRNANWYIKTATRIFHTKKASEKLVNRTKPAMHLRRTFYLCGGVHTSLHSFGNENTCTQMNRHRTFLIAENKVRSAVAKPAFTKKTETKPSPILTPTLTSKKSRTFHRQTSRECSAFTKAMRDFHFKYTDDFCEIQEIK